jgi:hypothetical protein
MTAGGIGATIVRLPMSWERSDARELAADVAKVTANLAADARDWAARARTA